MNNREINRSQPTPVSSRLTRIESGSPDRVSGREKKNKAHTRTLSPLPVNAMNALPPRIPTPPPSSSSSSSTVKTSGTIRSVPSEPPPIDTPIANENSRRSLNKSDPMPHSTRSEPSLSYNNTIPHSKNPSIPGPISLAVTSANSIQRRVSSEFGPTVAYTHSTSNLNVSANGNGIHLPPVDDGGGGAQWNSAVGRASLGKSGRVIERLQVENDKLRRDLNIEKTRAEESKRDASNVEAKMEEQRRDYEARLHLAIMDKTTLKRRERQLAELRGMIDGEREKAKAAAERELVWKGEMERVESESKRTVEEALDRAGMMEGRNNAMTSHWKEQGAEVNRTVKKLGKEIEKLVKERKADDERMNTLQGLCDQQAAQLKALEEEKAAIQKQFEEYKLFQDESLQGIKQKAAEQEQQNSELGEKMKRALGELRWALAVKNNVRGAQ